tara:strand:+ start:1166 stop:1594 length:429 start_codon:yes stop_codon:yes gene_type:complete
MSEEQDKENIDEAAAPGLSVALTNLDNLAKILTTVNKSVKSEKLKKSIEAITFLYEGFEKMKKNYPKIYKIVLGGAAILDPVGAIKATAARKVITAFVNSFGLNPPPELPQIDTTKPPPPPKKLEESLDRMQILAGIDKKEQ